MFTPKGDVAQWRPVYDVLATMEIDQVITYDRLTELIGQDARLNRAPVMRAMIELENENKRTLKNVRGVGYRMVRAIEHLDLAQSHHKRAHRQIGKGLAKARSADRSLLSPEERQRMDRAEIQLSRQEAMLRRLQIRQDEVEMVAKEARDLAERSHRSSEEERATRSEREERLRVELEDRLKAYIDENLPK